MPNILINSIPVDFPYEPYPSQIDYMAKVIQCLENRKFGLLESPTGTGKTLCLLCATLSWRKFIRNRINDNHIQKFNTDKFLPDSHLMIFDADAPDNLCIPNIIYASRTHSQLTHVIQQLKTTSYKSNVIVIGSREQLCIHPKVNNLQSNSDKVNLCRAMLKTRSCNFYNKFDNARSNSNVFNSNIIDIEDLLILGNELEICPYYYAREAKNMADIICMPYNYILDTNLRNINGIDIKNSIIILDEAHNIVKICEESVSFEISSIDIAHALHDIDYLIKLNVDLNIIDEKEELMIKLVNLKTTLLKCESNLDVIDVPLEGVIEDGVYIYAFFQKININFETAHIFIEQLDFAISYYSSTSAKFGFHRSSQTMQKFLDIVKILFSDFPNTGEDSCQHVKQLSKFYKVFIRNVSNIDSVITNGLLEADKTNRKYKIISYWCFSAGRSMKNMISNDIWTLILTSGTLSPIESLIYELQIDFPIQLQSPHVVDPNNIWVGVCKRGPNNIDLSSSYQNRNDPIYQHSLGESILSLSRVIPKGMLIFFPSYILLSNLLSAWRKTGILGALEESKQIFEEPKNKTDFVKVINNYTATLLLNDDIKFKDAALFAVCRGKVSEGLDFKDDVCRGLIIIGIPFPPKNDHYVQLKMKYLDEQCSDSMRKEILSGNLWYKQQASRAVNQALGRVIRHKHDYGAIVLADIRFSYSNNISDLPNWIKPNLFVYDNFSEAIDSLSQFYARMNISNINLRQTYVSSSNSKIEAFSLIRKQRSCKDEHKRKLDSLTDSLPKKNKFDSSIGNFPKIKCLSQLPLHGSIIDNMQIVPNFNTINRKINLYTNSKTTIYNNQVLQSLPSKTTINYNQALPTSINRKHKLIASKIISKMHISPNSNSLVRTKSNQYTNHINSSTSDVSSLEIDNIIKDEVLYFKPDLLSKTQISEMLFEAKSVLTPQNYFKLSNSIFNFQLNCDEEDFKAVLNSIFDNNSLKYLLNKFLCFSNSNLF